MQYIIIMNSIYHKPHQEFHNAPHYVGACNTDEEVREIIEEHHKMQQEYEGCNFELDWSNFTPERAWTKRHVKVLDTELKTIDYGFVVLNTDEC